MFEQFKDYFYFSRGEKNGIIVLIILIIILFFLPQVYSYFKPEKLQNSDKFKKEIAEFQKNLQKSENPKYKNRLDKYIIKRYDTIDLFFFNPNNCSKQDFVKLGLTFKQIKTIQNYLNKGGKFYKKSDFQRIYGIRNQQYLILKPYILLPNKENNYDNYNNYENYSEFDEEKAVLNDSLFQFDPNNTKKEDWTLLGFSDKQIKVIQNYTGKGGKFYKKEDLKKIYSISEKQYLRVEPYIEIHKDNETENIEKNNTNFTKSEVKNTIIELNTATFDDLIKLQGIGDYFANSIIRLRKKLGGFIKNDQLLEIKHFDKEKLTNIEKYIKVDKSKIKQIRVNFADIKELVSHPYLNYYQSKQIVEYRNTNGAFTNKKQLLENKILLKYTYRRIEPYLTVN